MNSTMKNNTEQKQFNGNANQQIKQDSPSELITRIEIKDTPFTVLKNNEEYFVLLGKYRLSEGYRTPEEAEINAKHWTWDRIMQVIGVMIEEYKK